MLMLLSIISYIYWAFVYPQKKHPLILFAHVFVCLLFINLLKVLFFLNTDSNILSLSGLRFYSLKTRSPSMFFTSKIYSEMQMP